MDTYTVDLESMGKRIRELRNTQNKTQEVFADMIHISSSYLALIEQGKRTASLDVVAQIAYTCHVSVDYLLFGKQESPSSENYKFFNILCRQYSDTSTVILRLDMAKHRKMFVFNSWIMLYCILERGSNYEYTKNYFWEL